jgi:glutaminyl-peptide cyclotransferase
MDMNDSSHFLYLADKPEKGIMRNIYSLVATRKFRISQFLFLGILMIGLSSWLVFNFLQPPAHFDGQRAFQDVLAQVSFGPRTPGSVAHDQTVAYIQKELEKAGWNVQIQVSEWDGYSIRNIIASRTDTSSGIIIGAHYDSRLLADQDSDPSHKDPVPGANDGASGVAVLLELARSLPSDILPVRLVFFDAEDNGGLDNRQWIMGSRAFVFSLTGKPKAVVIVDMVGDKDLNLFIERNSNPSITAEIWAQANALGFERNFISTLKYDMLDDHISFLEAGIPAVDIIDFDYPYWHTAADTVDKVSAQSLFVVGETLWEWIRLQK